jgi:hypothetical protein
MVIVAKLVKSGFCHQAFSFFCGQDLDFKLLFQDIWV